MPPPLSRTRKTRYCPAAGGRGKCTPAFLPPKMLLGQGNFNSTIRMLDGFQRFDDEVEHHLLIWCHHPAGQADFLPGAVRCGPASRDGNQHFFHFAQHIVQGNGRTESDPFPAYASIWRARSVAIRALSRIASWHAPGAQYCQAPSAPDAHFHDVGQKVVEIVGDTTGKLPVPPISAFPPSGFPFSAVAQYGALPRAIADHSLQRGSSMGKRCRQTSVCSVLPSQLCESRESVGHLLSLLGNVLLGRFCENLHPAGARGEKTQG